MADPDSAGPSWANNEDPKPSEKKNRPSDSKLRQQKLPAWQPILTAGTVIPTFFVIGFIFLPIGILLFVSSQKIKEEIFDYTDSCTQDGSQCKDVVRNWTIANKNWDQTCTCTIDLGQKHEKVDGDVYFYYGLTNFYQNHRRYVKSRSDYQLLGNLDSTDDCAPFTNHEEGDKSYPFAPCGAIANSMFNDTFKLKWSSDKKGSNKQEVPLDWSTITWPTDHFHKFRNPKGELNSSFSETRKPINWKKHPYELDLDNKNNNGFMNGDFIVWMRTAALPTFRKLWRKLNRTEGTNFEKGLPAGYYTLEVEYNYLVDEFGGQKRFIMSTTSWVGGKNDFLGVAYMVVGSLCILLGVIFLGIHLKFGKSLTEMSTVGGRS